MSTKHPEDPADAGQLQTFRIRTAFPPEVEAQLDKEISDIDQRIQTICERVLINNVPLVSMILNVSRSRRDLQVLGKALLKVGPLLEERAEKAKKKGLLELVRTEPGYLASVLGDFDSDIEEIERMLDEQ